MSEGQRRVTFQEWVGQLRGQIILAYDGSKEIALKNFDLMTTKFSLSLYHLCHFLDQDHVLHFFEQAVNTPS